jgi:hypothetical protein
MADRILKPDSGNDLVLQNNGGTGKIEINDGVAVITLTGDLKVGGNDIQDSGGVVCFSFDGSGNTNFADKILQRPEIKDYGESVNAIGNTVASQTIDLTAGNVITATLNVATTTFTFSNSSATGKACSFTLILTQDGSGSRAVTWPGSVQWASSTAPTLSTGAADVDIFAFITVDAGTTWFGFTGGLDMDI